MNKASSSSQDPSLDSPKIDSSWTIGKIFSTFPHINQQIAQALTQEGLSCAGCSAATWETLEAGMLGHGKSNDDINRLVIKLNSIIDIPLNADSITITPYAAEKLHEYALKEGKKDWSLRFSDKAGGCGGFEYILDFTQDPEEDDQVFESCGVKIFVAKNGLSRLLGAHIDFHDSLYGGGFKISNPNAKSSCSCGTSHNY